MVNFMLGIFYHNKKTVLLGMPGCGLGRLLLLPPASLLWGLLPQAGLGSSPEHTELPDLPAAWPWGPL